MNLADMRTSQGEVCPINVNSADEKKSRCEGRLLLAGGLAGARMPLATGPGSAELRFKCEQTPLKFPLGGGFLARVKEGFAPGRRRGAAQCVLLINLHRSLKMILERPEARARQEAVFHTSASQRCP